MSDEWTKIIFAFLSGGFLGSVFTFMVNIYRNKIQKMHCCYIEDDIMSKVPILNNDGSINNNLHTKKFILKNTTNIDHETFGIIFEFDKTSKIIRDTNSTKSGIDKLSKSYTKDNEYFATIRNLNRKEEVEFTFVIANITEDRINITETNCRGFKIVYKDKRKKHIKSKVSFVTKKELN